jgi:glucose-1-phosphate thymidylyltransferase
VANQPLVSRSVASLAQAGIRDIAVVVAPGATQAFAAILGNGGNWGARITLIQQFPALGPAHAVAAARDFLGGHPFVVLLGDVVFGRAAPRLLRPFNDQCVAARVLVGRVDDPSGLGQVAVDDQGRVIRLAEKPQQPLSHLVLAGAYRLGPSIHEAIARLKPSSRGEYELTEALQILIDDGCRVAADPVVGWWKDAGRPQDLLQANRLALSELSADIAGLVTGSRLAGPVVVEEGARVQDSVVCGPVHIAGGAVLTQAHIASHTSIGAGARITRSDVGNSILLDKAEVHDVPGLVRASILGQGAVVRGDSDPGYGGQGDATRSEVRRHTGRAGPTRVTKLILSDASRVYL